MRTSLFHGARALAGACAIAASLSTPAARADILPPDTESCIGKSAGDPCQVCTGTTVFDGVCTNSTCTVGARPDSAGVPRPCTRCLGKDGSEPPFGGPCPDAGTKPTDDAGSDGGGGGGTDAGGASPTVEGGGCSFGRASELGAWSLALLVPAISYLTRRRKGRDAQR